jgi:lactoylglutathione lyase
LDDPRVNFAVSTRSGNRIGVDHLGIQVDSSDELTEITARLEAADKRMFKQNEAACCYVVSDKVWVADPQGIPWETFYSYADDTSVSADVLGLVEERAENRSDASGCCRS